MKVLFLTSFNVAFEREHFFTMEVFKKLSSYPVDIILASIILSDKIETACIHRNECFGREYYVLELPRKKADEEYIVSSLVEFLHNEKIDLVHSNMIEGYDIQACKRLNIPICLTVHIGGFICPRSGGNGFLRYDDTICNQPISKPCVRCLSKNLPFRGVSYLLLRSFPLWAARFLKSKLRNRQILYLTEFLEQKTALETYRKRLKLFQYATLIVANQKLLHLLELNNLHHKAKLIPHGVRERRRLAFPPLNANTPVKFYYIGRVQYSKGLHILLKALQGIDPSLYELHIIGDAESPRKEQRYYEYIQRLSEGLNVTFHGRLTNETLETYVADYHVMIHPCMCLEVYGIAIAEALSMGRPVLATRCGGAEMQVRDRFNGWLVAPNQITDIRNKIIHIIENRQEIYDYACCAALPHNIEDYARQLVSTYEEIADYQANTK